MEQTYQSIYRYLFDKISNIKELKKYDDLYLTDPLMKDFEIRESNKSAEIINGQQEIKNLNFDISINLPNPFPGLLEIRDLCQQALADLYQQKRSLVYTLLKEKESLIQSAKEDGFPWKKIYQRRQKIKCDFFYDSEFDCLVLHFTERGNFYIDMGIPITSLSYFPKWE